MRCTNKKSILIIIFSLLILIIIVLFASSVYFYLSKDYKAKNSENTTSYPVSDTDSTSKNIKFTIDTPEMIIRPEKSVIEAKSFLDSTYEIEVKGIAASIKGEGFEIYMFSNMGESGGFHKSVSIESIITENKLGEKLFKVKTAHENLDGNTLEDQYQQYFFYTSDFRTMEQCGNVMPGYDGCGSLGMSIVTEGDGNYSFSIFCGVNDSSLVLQCDEFVKNLDVKIEKVHNIVAFSLEYLNPKDNSLSDKNIELNAYYTDGMSLTDSKPNYVILRRFDFAIMLLTSLEETSFEETSVLENTEIANNKLNEQIFRVKSFDQFTNEFKELFHQNYINYYFYTSDFKTNDACGKEQIKSCGSKSVEAWEEHPLRIYCASNTTEGVSECDKFVKDLAAKN